MRSAEGEATGTFLVCCRLYCKCSFGIRFLCNKKMRLAHRLARQRHAGRMKLVHDGQALLTGTWARVVQTKQVAVGDRPTQTIALEDCDAGTVLIARSTIVAGRLGTGLERSRGLRGFT